MDVKAKASAIRAVVVAVDFKFISVSFPALRISNPFTERVRNKVKCKSDSRVTTP